MPIIPDVNIAAYAHHAGFSGTTLPVMVAICLAESGGNPKAHNKNASTGDNSYGLGQVNMLGKLEKERKKKYNIDDNDELFIPYRNLEVCWLIFRDAGNKFTPWSTYNRRASNPQWSKLLARGKKSVVDLQAQPDLESKLVRDEKQAVSRLGIPGFVNKWTFGLVGPDADITENSVPDPVDGVASAITGAVKGGVDAITGALFKIGINVGGIALGFLLFVVGMAIITKTSPAKVASVVPAGRALKVAGNAAKAAKVARAVKDAT